jgi:hypothetical protein
MEPEICNLFEKLLDMGPATFTPFENALRWVPLSIIMTFPMVAKLSKVTPS